MTSRWRDNDVYAHMNNAVFYEYIDTVVNAWLIKSGALDVPGGDVVGLVVHSECDFFASLGFPGTITGALRTAKVGNSSVTYEVALFGEDDTAAALSRFTHVYVDAITRRPVSLPDSLKGGSSQVALKWPGCGPVLGVTIWRSGALLKAPRACL